MLEYFCEYFEHRTAIRYKLWPFGIVCGHLVNISRFWYVLTKNLATMSATTFSSSSKTTKRLFLSQFTVLSEIIVMGKLNFFHYTFLMFNPIPWRDSISRPLSSVEIGDDATRPRRQGPIVQF
jgi:hypothetical protein